MQNKSLLLKISNENVNRFQADSVLNKFKGRMTRLISSSKMTMNSGLMSSSSLKSAAGQGLTDNEVQQKLEKMKMAFNSIIKDVKPIIFQEAVEFVKK